MAGTGRTIRRISRVVAIAALALAIAACSRQAGEVYQRPPGEVRDLLRTVEVPLYMYGNSTDTQSTVDASDPSSIVWKITADDHPLMKFTATLKPEGETATRVAVVVEGTKVGKFSKLHAQLEKMKEVKALYLVSMTEAVDSTLEGRSYDITRTYPALMSATTANLGLFKPPSSAKDDPS